MQVRSVNTAAALALTGLLTLALQAPAGCAPRSADDWTAGAPADVGLDGPALERLAADIRAGQFGNVHAVLVARRGRLAFESYFSGEDAIGGRGSVGHVTFGPDTLHDLRSVTKTIVSTLVGIAMSQGHIRSLDTPVHVLLPARADRLGGEKQAITLRHLLTMTAGFAWDESSFDEDQNDEIRMNRSGDALGHILSKDMVAAPGTVFRYSGGATQLLAAIVEAGTGRQIGDYAREVLFSPLGIERFEWPLDLQGMPRAASGLRLGGRDAMKVGLMFAAGGRWNGRQVVPGAWLEDAMRTHQALPVLPDDKAWILRAGYGYQWRFEEYVTSAGPAPTHYASGNGGQRIYLVPSLDIVVVTLAGLYNQDTLTPEDILQRVVAATR